MQNTTHHVIIIIQILSAFFLGKFKDTGKKFTMKIN